MRGVRTPRPGYLPGTLFQCGPMMEKISDCASSARHGVNRGMLWELNRRVKLFHGPDGWFADGTRGQVWEYGRKKLGFTVGSGSAVIDAASRGFTPTQLGDGEANFCCEWTPENVEKLIELLRLRIRRGPPKRSITEFI